MFELESGIVFLVEVLNSEHSGKEIFKVFEDKYPGHTTEEINDFVKLASGALISRGEYLLP